MTGKEEKTFDFWNDHSLEFLEMAYKRDYLERLDACDGYGKKIRSCGDTVEIFLQVKDEVIDSISYDIKGCLFSHACMNTLIKLSVNKSLSDACKLEALDIINYLKTLPEQEEHCADHVLAAFHTAVEDYRKRS